MIWVKRWCGGREATPVEEPPSASVSSAFSTFSMPFWRVLLGGVLLFSGIGMSWAAETSDTRQAPASAASQWIEGQVTAIVDGDTLHLDGNAAKYVVDLAGIDAPEKGQRSGDMAAQVLYLKVLKKQVKVLVLPATSPSPVVSPVSPTPTKVPAFSGSVSGVSLRRRVYGIVYCDGCVNAELVGEGLAWHDGKRCPSTALAQAEAMARTGRRGLWRGDEEPIPPWQWRRERRTRAASPSGSASPGQQVRDLSRLFEASTPAAAMEAAAQVQPVVSLSAQAAPQMPGPVAGGSFWLTTSSGIRHNSDCRYFGTSKGRACSAAEGRPCQKCGG